MVIAFLTGRLHSRELASTNGSSDRIVIDVGGVGFETLVSRTTASQIGQIDETVTIHTTLCIRENDWSLFGFNSIEEKEMFSLLQQVSGVGPKMALSLVGTLGPLRIAESVTAEDAKTLSQAPGVGAKLAQRIILELKSKLDGWQLKRGITTSTTSKTHAQEEAITILENLGYTLTEINAAFKQLTSKESSQNQDVESIVKYSLKVLGSG